MDNGNGELAFTSYDENVKGIITVNEWDGASFKVPDASADAILIVNEAFEFPLGF